MVSIVRMYNNVEYENEMVLFAEKNIFFEFYCVLKGENLNSAIVHADYTVKIGIYHKFSTLGLRKICNFEKKIS